MLLPNSLIALEIELTLLSEMGRDRSGLTKKDASLAARKTASLDSLLPPLCSPNEAPTLKANSQSFLRCLRLGICSTSAPSLPAIAKNLSAEAGSLTS